MRFMHALRWWNGSVTFIHIHFSRLFDMNSPTNSDVLLMYESKMVSILPPVGSTLPYSSLYSLPSPLFRHQSITHFKSYGPHTRFVFLCMAGWNIWVVFSPLLGLFRTELAFYWASSFYLSSTLFRESPQRQADYMLWRLTWVMDNCGPIGRPAVRSAAHSVTDDPIDGQTDRRTDK